MHTERRKQINNRLIIIIRPIIDLFTAFGVHVSILQTRMSVRRWTCSVRKRTLAVSTLSVASTADVDADMSWRTRFASQVHMILSIKLLQETHQQMR